MRERAVAASSEKQIFNILGTSASRAVSISAASTAATVKFGIAENPFVQFVSAQFDDVVDGSAIFSGGEYGGLVSNAWRLVVTRGEIVTNAVRINVCGYDATTTFPCDRTTTQMLFHARPTFAKDARLRYVVQAASSTQDHVFYIYGFRAYRGWLDDATIERIRDLDAAELTRRDM